MEETKDKMRRTLSKALRRRSEEREGVAGESKMLGLARQQKLSIIRGTPTTTPGQSFC